jgi:magnesium transporter
MTVRTVLQRTEPPLVWLDVVHPTVEELDEIARAHGLQTTAVKDCLEPEHLPKFEQFENHVFAIIRAFDAESNRTATTVQELTRKLAIFSGASFLITIHRTDMPWLAAVEARFQAEQAAKPGKEGLQTFCLTQILNAAVDTFLPPMEAIEARIDAFEELVFGGRDADDRAFAEDLRDIHVLKRQVTLIKRLLWRAFTSMPTSCSTTPIPSSTSSSRSRRIGRARSCASSPCSRYSFSRSPSWWASTG